MTAHHEPQRGIIAYFANNPVAANLMMLFIVVLGIVSYMSIQRQMFPNQETNFVNVSATYRGASPQEVEQSILIKIEEALKDVTEIKKLTSRGFRGSGRVTLEIHQEADLAEVTDKIKQRVDSIATFPADMEPVTITQREFQQRVMELALVGDLPLLELKPIAKQLETELLQLNNVSLVGVQTPPYEISIEVQPDTLRKYNLSIHDITRAISRHSGNFSAGQLRTEAGYISVRIENQYYQGEEFGQIPVKIGANGGKVLLQDVATIHDGLVEGERFFKYNDVNAVFIEISATSSQNMVPVAESVKAFVDHRNQSLPQGLELKVLVDMTYYLNARLDMMLKNLLQGAMLVALMLSIFLRFRLAFWVMVGLPVCFLGAVMMMPVLGVSINIMSLFAFIMVLGIVVDDAIVIGESAYTEIETRGGGIANVVRGAKRVATPATFGVLTTIAVFGPFLLGTGQGAERFYNVAAVVVLCLIFSLIESKLILPAHLAHTTFKPVKKDSWRARFNQRFMAFVHGPYKRFLEKCIKQRWLVFSTFIALLMVSVGLLMGNYVRFIPMPKVPHDYPKISIEMNENVSDAATIEALKTIKQSIEQVEQQIIDQTGQGMIRDLLVFNSGRTEGQILTALVDEEVRPFNTFELSRRWREAIPPIAGMKSFSIQDTPMGGGDDGDFGFLLFGPDIDTLNTAGRTFIERLQQQKGIYDVSSTMDPISKEVRLSLKPVAYELGLSLNEVARQTGASFYGAEAQRVLRGGEEVRVMVRYPELTRQRYAELKYAVLTTPSGKEVMLGDVAELVEKPGISYIRREGGYRSIYVWGAIDQDQVEPNEVVGHIRQTLLPELTKQFPGIKTQLGGAIEEEQAQQDQQKLFFIAGMIIVFILLAVPLKSYSQPLLIMSVIPFSLTGALWGHFLLGLDMSMMSTFGLIAAAGVVINDSLVMTDFINQRRRDGIKMTEAVVQAGCARFRAITLTSITTFAGVLPIMFETSLQAQFVIPMAVALGFAVLYATLVTLILVPCLYLILGDLRRPFSAIRTLLARRGGTPRDELTTPL